MGRFVFQNLGDDWEIDMEWREGDYQGGPIGMWIRPLDPDNPPHGGLSSTVLREIDFRKAKAKLHQDLAAHPHGWRGEPSKQAQQDGDRLARLRDELAKGITPEYLALLCSNYVQRVNSGQAKPVERLAEDLGKSAATIRGHLWQARRQGLLIGSAGRKGGTLTPEAMAIIQRLPKQPNPEIPVQRISLIHDGPPGGMEDMSGDR
nr:sigma-70 family RNA polymerase sigma factor [Mycobacterium sp. UM_NZ2]